MATYNFTGIITTPQTFDSADDVTFTSPTVNAGGSIVKTDALAMTIKCAAANLAIFNSTGYVDIQGSRGAFVLFDSNQTNKKAGDWNRFDIAGSSASNTMKWCIFKNGGVGLRFSGSAASVAEGAFQYLIGYNCNAGTPGLNDTTTGGSVVVSDIAAIKCSGSGISKNTVGGSTTWKKCTIINWIGAATGITRTMTIQDWFMLGGNSGFNPTPAAGNTISITRMYSRFGGGHGPNPAATGIITIADSIFKGGTATVLNNTGTGQIQITSSDIVGGNSTTAGLAGNNANAWTLTDTSISATAEASDENFDISTATPNSGSTPAQYTNAQTVTSPRSSLKFQRTISNIVEGAPTSDAVTITADAGIPCKMRVIYGTASGVYTMSTEWDAVDLLVSEIGETLKSVVSDWGKSGATYKMASHSLPLSNLKSGTTYFYKIEAEDMFGNLFQSSQDSFSTTGDSAAPTWDSSVGIISLSKDISRKALNVAAGNATAGGDVIYPVYVQANTPTGIQVNSNLVGYWNDNNGIVVSHLADGARLDANTTYYVLVTAMSLIGQSETANTNTLSA